MGVFNGDIGQITDIDPLAPSLVTVDFEGHLVEYTPDMLGELEPAYAVTVHKAQGSEYRAVILVGRATAAPMLLTRGVLYTAITRARELLILVGDDAGGGPHGRQRPPAAAVQRAAGPAVPGRPRTGGEPCLCANNC